MTGFIQKAALIALGAVLLTSGCATKHPPMTRAEYLAMTSRSYEGVTPAEVFAATEQLFLLADPDDVQFTHGPDEIRVTRPWTVYLVLSAARGTDYWRIQATAEGGTTTVFAAANQESNVIVAAPTAQGDVYAGTVPMGGAPIAGTAIYDVFWDRLDYLLGKRAAWTTCAESNRRQRAGEVWGDNSALCNGFNVANLLPSGEPELARDSSAASND